MGWTGKRYEEPIDLFLPFGEAHIADTFAFIMGVLLFLCEEELGKESEGMPPAFRYSEKQIGVDYRVFLEIVGEYMGNKIKLSQDYGLDEPTPINKWARLFFNAFYAKTMRLGFAGFYSAFDPTKSHNPKLVNSHYASYATNMVLEHRGYYVEMKIISMLDDRLMQFSQETYNRLARLLSERSPRMASGKGATPPATWERLKAIGVSKRLYR
ncbi:MAG: hypothetical protein LBP89_10095 [Helicobacteraceae bacterium]|jgi:hypothetical protein|nr:hypothetical protein [Helicobacteraceae bacterium]